jgi:integrase/ribosomal protein L37AE/L43A
MEMEAVAPDSPHGLGEGEYLRFHPRLRPQCPQCGSQRLFKDGLRRLKDGSSIQRWLCRGCGYRFSFGPKNLMGKAEKSQALALNPSSSITSDRQGSHEGPDPGLGPEPDPGIGTGGGTGGGTRAPIALEAMKTLAGEAEGCEKQDAGATATAKETGQETEKETKNGNIGSKTSKEQEDKKGSKTDKTLLEFAWWLKKQGRSENTIEDYTKLLRLLIKNGASLLDPESVKDTLAKVNKSASWKVLAVAAYTAYLKMHGGTWNPPKYEAMRKIPFIPTEEEIDALIAGCGPKTAAFLQLLKETGMRAGEANRLRWTDVDLERLLITLNEPEKHGKPRIFRISHKLALMLGALPRKNEYVFGGTLFSRKSCLHLSRRAIARKLGNPRLERITYHTIRHWKATMEYHKTKDLLHVKELLGHRKLDTTALYIQLDRAYFQEANDEFHFATAKTIEEAGKLIEAGFDYVATFQDVMLFRKRK